MNNKKPEKFDTGALSWVFIVIAFAFFWPAGLFLLISRLKGKDYIGNLLSSLFGSSQSGGGSGSTQRGDPGRSSSTTRGSWQSSSEWPPRSASAAPPRSSPPPQRPVRQEAPRPEAPRQESGSGAKAAAAPSPESGKHISRVSKGKGALQVFGWILLAVGALVFIDGDWRYSFWNAMQMVGTLLAGAGLVAAAVGKKRRENRYRKCVNVVGGRSHISLDALSKSTGLNMSDLEKDLEDMVNRGYFGDTAYYDNATRTLIVKPEEARQRLRREAEAAAAERNAAKAREAAMHKDQYDLLLDELGRSVSRIRDKEMSDKAKLIYSLASAIFDAVRDDEEKRPKLATFLNYYFPTTIKLFNNYSEFESQGYQGEYLSRTRDRIESTADLIITAYRKQLDALYLSDTIDVDSDIDVLESMLRRDGLTESDFSVPGV